MDSPNVYTTRVSRLIRAPRSKVYTAMIDPDLIPRWKVPDDMTMTVHEFEAREGGAYRISLTYQDPNAQGKTAENTDTYRGHFLRLVPNELVVQEDEFESPDALLRAAMISTFVLREGDGGTLLECTHENVPAAVREVDNQTGWEMALAKLAELVENSRQ